MPIESSTRGDPMGAADRYQLNSIVLVGMPTLEPRPISFGWTEAYYGMSFPLGTSMTRVRVHDQIVDDARNQIVQAALDANATHVMMIGDDVHVPSDAFVRLLRHDVDIITGIYWTKSYPSEPYIWRGVQNGPYTDWKVGEFFEIDMTGCDCLLVKTDVFRKIPKPWFSRDWGWNGEPPSHIATEDFVFYSKAKAAGYKVWADTMVQCYHEDRSSGQLFGIQSDYPQAIIGYQEMPGDVEPLRVAVLGPQANGVPWFGSRAQITRFDHREKDRPDVRCDLTMIPRNHFDTYDIVNVRHVLEHYAFLDAQDVVKHWSELVKVGGEIRVCVPDILAATREVYTASEEGRPVNQYALMQLWGGQEDAADFHRSGYNVDILRSLLTHNLPGEWTVRAWRNADEANVYASAKLVRRKPLTAIIDGFARNPIEGYGYPVEETVSVPLPDGSMTARECVDKADKIGWVPKVMFEPKVVEPSEAVDAANRVAEQWRAGAPEVPGYNPPASFGANVVTDMSKESSTLTERKLERTYHDVTGKWFYPLGLDEYGAIAT